MEIFKKLNFKITNPKNGETLILFKDQENYYQVLPKSVLDFAPIGQEDPLVQQLLEDFNGKEEKTKKSLVQKIETDLPSSIKKSPFPEKFKDNFLTAKEKQALKSKISKSNRKKKKKISLKLLYFAYLSEIFILISTLIFLLSNLGI